MGFLLPIHIISYGYTLGSTSFHSFIASPKALETLPRRQFGEFQGEVLPIQFWTQTLAPIVIGLTAPYTISAIGLGLLATSSFGGIANLGYLTPLCQDLKDKRWKIIDDKFNGDDKAANESGDLDSLNKQFGKWHGLSMLSNLVSIVTLTAYGFVLSGKLKV